MVGAADFSVETTASSERLDGSCGRVVTGAAETSFESSMGRLGWVVADPGLGAKPSNVLGELEGALAVGTVLGTLGLQPVQAQAEATKVHMIVTLGKDIGLFITGGYRLCNRPFPSSGDAHRLLIR